jgi:hypothetical protein
MGIALIPRDETGLVALRQSKPDRDRYDSPMGRADAGRASTDQVREWSSGPCGPSSPSELETLLEAECLGYEDDVDASRRVVVDDQRFGEQAAGAAGGLHSRVFLGEAVFVYSAEAFIEVADEFLVADDEDYVPAGVGVRPELATRPEPTMIWPSSVIACALPTMYSGAAPSLRISRP